jgi:hypothetical protein
MRKNRTGIHNHASESFGSARTTSKSRYTFAIQPFFDISLRFVVRSSVETFEPFFANDESSTVPECLGPRPEGAPFDELTETFDEFRRERDPHRLSITAHVTVYSVKVYNFVVGTDYSQFLC